MRTIQRNNGGHARVRRGIAAPLLALACGVMAATGCVRPPGADAPGQAVGGAQLWADNCARCHNMRPSDQYGDKEWGVIMLHMRVRSNITGPEYRAVRAFLQSGH